MTDEISAKDNWLTRNYSVRRERMPLRRERKQRCGPGLRSIVAPSEVGQQSARLSLQVPSWYEPARQAGSPATIVGDWYERSSRYPLAGA